MQVHTLRSMLERKGNDVSESIKADLCHRHLAAARLFEHAFRQNHLYAAQRLSRIPARLLQDFRMEGWKHQVGVSAMEAFI